VKVGADAIAARLRERLAAVHVEVIDESDAHAGHAGARPEGGTHFRALVVSERFSGLSRVAAQRLVYDALGDWMGDPVHAFACRTLTPAAWERGS
jgi:BolA protein